MKPRQEYAPARIRKSFHEPLKEIAKQLGMSLQALCDKAHIDLLKKHGIEVEEQPKGK